MQRLIIFRCATYTGDMQGTNTIRHLVRHLDKKSRRRLDQAVATFKSIVDGKSFAVITADRPYVRETANYLARSLGKVQPYLTRKLGDSTTQNNLSAALEYLRDDVPDREVIIAVVDLHMANSLPAFLGRYMPGFFPIWIKQTVRRSEGVDIDLVNHTYAHINSPKDDAVT